MTNYENGLASYGFPLIGSGGFFSVRAAADKEIFFVDGTNGNDGNTGKNVSAAKKTIQAALNLCNHDKGSYVFVGEGNYAEQITINKRGVHLIGMGAYRTSIVPASTMTAKDLVTPVISVIPLAAQPTTTQGVEIAGIRVSGAGGYTGIYLGDGVSGDAANASACFIHDCIIDGSNREGLYGIVIRGGSFIRIVNNLIVSWTQAGVVIMSGSTRTAYYNVVDSNWIISGGTCGVALNATANSNIISKNIFCDDSTTAFTSCIQVAALLGGASGGTDNVAAGNLMGSAGTNGALLNAGDHLVGNFGRNAGNDASSYIVQTATWGSL